MFPGLSLEALHSIFLFILIFRLSYFTDIVDYGDKHLPGNLGGCSVFGEAKHVAMPIKEGCSRHGTA